MRPHQSCHPALRHRGRLQAQFPSSLHRSLTNAAGTVGRNPISPQPYRHPIKCIHLQCSQVRSTRHWRLVFSRQGCIYDRALVSPGTCRACWHKMWKPGSNGEGPTFSQNLPLCSRNTLSPWPWQTEIPNYLPF